MAPKFSTPRTVVNVTATIPAQANGWTITENDVKAALESAARQNGVTVDNLTVTLSQGPREVTLSEAEYNALLAGGSAQPAE